MADLEKGLRGHVLLPALFTHKGPRSWPNPHPSQPCKNGPENRHWSDLRQVRRTYSPYRNCFVGGVEVYSDLGKMSPRISIYHDPHPPYPPPLSMKTQDFSTTKPPSPPHTLPIRCAPSPLIFFKTIRILQNTISELTFGKRIGLFSEKMNNKRIIWLFETLHPIFINNSRLPLIYGNLPDPDPNTHRDGLPFKTSLPILFLFYRTASPFY